MASTVDEECVNFESPNIRASSDSHSVLQLQTPHFHSGAVSSPDSQQPTSPIAGELPSIIDRNSNSLTHEATALDSSFSSEIAPSFGQAPRHLTGSSSPNIYMFSSNTSRNINNGREQIEVGSNPFSGCSTCLLPSNYRNTDPTSSAYLAAPGFTCFCPACEFRRSELGSTSATNFLAAQNNYNIDAGNAFGGETAENSTQFTTRNPYVSGNTDYFPSSISISRPESESSPGYSISDRHQRPIPEFSATLPSQNSIWESDRFEDIPEDYELQFAYASGSSLYKNPIYSLMSPHSTRSWNPSSTFSPGIAHDTTNNVGHSPSARLSQTQSYSGTGQSYHHAPRKRGARKRLTPSLSLSEESQSTSISMTPAGVEFLKALDYLEVELKNSSNLTIAWKKSFAKFLNITVMQLEIYIEAKKVIEPKMKELAKAAENHGIPTENIAAWFLQGQHQKPSRDFKNDSGYHSNINSSQEPSRPVKRRKKTAGDEAPLKQYQCTFINGGKSYCLQLSKDYGDWKRHEEKHYPQRRWVCLIRGSDEARSCYECSESINLIGEPMTITHEACLTRPARHGHFFSRRDKLVAHVRSEHQCEASISSWHQNISSDWKRQCGFCGEKFSEWEERCHHVGLHFQNGKRMIPDWKDPWPSLSVNPNQRPDDDDDDNNDNDIDNNDIHQGENGEKGNPAPEDNSRGNGQGDKQQRDNGNEGKNDTSSHGSGRGWSKREVQSEKSDSQDRDQHNTIPGQSDSINEVSQCYSEQRRSSQEISLPFRSVRELGYGAFGTVDEIIHSPSNIRFARKRIRNSVSEPSQASVQVRKEITCLRQLNHEHIIKVMAFYTVQDHISIIMSPIADCSLWEFIRHPVVHNHTERSHLSRWFGCLASALSYVHGKSWLHMDLKPQNILISGDRVLLSDFGSAYSVVNRDAVKMAGIRYAITPMYCAPEMLHKGVSEAATWASDIYSLGCIYLEMATGILRQSITSFEELRSFGNGDKSFNRNEMKCTIWIDSLQEVFKNMSPGMRDKDFQIIRSMLSFDVTKRPTAQYLEKLYSKDYCCGDGSHNIASYYFVKPVEQPFFDLMLVASTWLRTCDMYHKHCSHRVMDFFPTRILNVGAEGDTIRLQSSFHEFASPYIALSHCWGSGNVLKTTSQTLDERFLGIQSSSLSNTFQNAVRITRALGFNYLWIDSLCIVQDSPEDWAKVSSQMHKIYSNSYLTISILNEEDSQITCSRGSVARKRTGEHSCRHECRAFKPLLEDTATTAILDNAISQRAWTLQERLLSPRVLHCSSTRLAWECGSGTSIFDSISMMRNSMGVGKRVLSSHLLESNDLCMTTLQPPSAAQVRKFWQDIVREYSQRQLTRPSDKLTALAGLAASISALGGGEYLAGLWSGDLKHGLLWSRDLCTPPTARPAYRAPSWSWTSIDGQVVWSKSVTDLPDDWTTIILSCSTTLCSKFSPFGAVLGGHLEISGPMQKVFVFHPYIEQLLENASSKPIAFAQWDALVVPAKADCVRQSKKNRIEGLWCLQILHGAGLVLKERSNCEEVFERVGIYWTRVDATNDKAGEGCWKQRSVTIV